MEKIKQITIKVKRWQAGMALAASAIILSYLLAATMPEDHGGIFMFHVFGMFASGVAGTIIFIISMVEMWEKWDG